MFLQPFPDRVVNSISPIFKSKFYPGYSTFTSISFGK